VGKICVNLCKIAVCALMLQKWHPKWKWRRVFFVWKSCFDLVVFGQVRRNLGKLGWNWGAFTWKIAPIEV